MLFRVSESPLAGLGDADTVEERALRVRGVVEVGAARTRHRDAGVRS
jgi:hypothetical protein